MARKKIPSRIVRAIADVMWERDRLQMRAMDTLASAVAPPRRRTKLRRSRKAKGRR
jgi:hypothetical protein